MSSSTSQSLSPSYPLPNSSKLISRRRPSSAHSFESKSPVTITRNQPTTTTTDSAIGSDGTSSNSLSPTVATKPVNTVSSNV